MACMKYFCWVYYVVCRTILGIFLNALRNLKHSFDFLYKCLGITVVATKLKRGACHYWVDFDVFNPFYTILLKQQGCLCLIDVKASLGADTVFFEKAIVKISQPPKYYQFIPPTDPTCRKFIHFKLPMRESTWFTTLPKIIV